MPKVGPPNPATLAPPVVQVVTFFSLEAEIDRPHGIGRRTAAVRRAGVDDAVDENEACRPGAGRKEWDRRFCVGPVARQDGVEQSIGAHRVDGIDAAKRYRRHGRRIWHGAGGHRTGGSHRCSSALRGTAAGGGTRLAEHCGSGARCTDGAAAPPSPASAPRAAGRCRRQTGAPARRRDQPTGARERARRLSAGIRRVVQHRRPVRLAQVGIDREHAIAAPADERERLEPAEPDQPIEEDRLGQRVHLPRVVLEP